MKRDDALALMDMIRDIGYRAIFDESSQLIDSSVAGLRYALSYFPGKSLQFYCGMVRDPSKEFSLAEANDANRKYRFAKYTIDDDGDLVLESDFPFDADASDARAQLQTILGIWEGSVSLMKEEFAKAPSIALLDRDTVLPAETAD